MLAECLAAWMFDCFDVKISEISEIMYINLRQMAGDLLAVLIQHHHRHHLHLRLSAPAGNRL